MPCWNLGAALRRNYARIARDLLVMHLLFGFSIGGLLASASPQLFLLLSPLILIVCSLRRYFFSIALSCLAGIVWVNLAWVDQDVGALPEFSGKLQETLEGKISNIKHQSFRVQFDFTSGDRRYLVSCYRCEYAPEWGETWRLALNVQPFHSLQNPNGFKYRRWMLSKGYFAKATVKNKSLVNQRLQLNQEIQLRGWIDRQIHPDQYPILRALMLGDKSSMAAEQKRLINASGLSHLFVVSGLHVGMVATSILLLVLLIQRPLVLLGWSYSMPVAVCISFCAAGFYGYLSGFNTPAIRAVMMLVIAGIFLMLQRQISPLYYLLYALCGVLIISPLAFFDMGSWLSFSIVAGLVVGFNGLRPLGWLKALLLAQFIAFCVGGVVLTLYGQGVSLFGLFANLLLIPLMTLVLVPLALLGLAFLGSEFGWMILTYIERILTSGVEVIGLLSEVIPFLLPIHGGNQWLWVVSFALLMKSAMFNRWGLSVVVVLIAWLLPPSSPPKGGFKVTALDVGQGSSALIQTHEHNLLVDTGVGYEGSLTMVDFVVEPLLRRKGIQQLDELHLTHDDLDHSGGAFLLKGRSRNVTTQANCDYQEWSWDGVRFVRFQASGFSEGNNGSCLLRVSGVGGSILFAGDIESEAEDSLLDSDPHLLKADVLVVPHHGSRTSSTGPFLDAVSPSEALISAGFLNRYHHPHPEVIGRYEARSVKIYSTASQGAIEVVFSPRQENHIVSTYRPNLAFE